MHPEVLSRVASVHGEAFDRWFGDSKVVDPQGNPKVVYHGTRHDFESFNAESWFAEDVRVATVFVGGGRRSDGRVKPGSVLVPVYLAISKPLDLSELNVQTHMQLGAFLKRAGVPESDFPRLLQLMEDDALAWWEAIKGDPKMGDHRGSHRMPGKRGWSAQQRTLEQCLLDEAPLWHHLDFPLNRAFLREYGYDGVKLRESVKYNPRLAEGRRYSAKHNDWVGCATWMTFDSTQVKSAIANSGTYDPEDPRIAFKLAEPSAEVMDVGEDEDDRCAPRF